MYLGIKHERLIHSISDAFCQACWNISSFLTNARVEPVAVTHSVNFVHSHLDEQPLQLFRRIDITRKKPFMIFIAVKYKITDLSAHFLQTVLLKRHLGHLFSIMTLIQTCLRIYFSLFSYLQIKSNVFGMTSLEITLPYLVAHPLLTTQAFIIYRYKEQYEVPIRKRVKMS